MPKIENISSKGMALIKYYEGFSPQPYICPAGKLTIGYGHVILPAEKAKYEIAISPWDADKLLMADVQAACRSVCRNIDVPLTQGQFDALVSFTFNLGGGALQASTLRQRLNRGEYTAAAEQFVRWVYAGGMKSPGLIKRRADERALFLGEIANEGIKLYIHGKGGNVYGQEIGRKAQGES